MDEMVICSSEDITGKKIVETIGLVKGNTVRAKWFGKDFLAGLRNLVGGELKEYTEMLSEAREQAINRMIEDAKQKNADAIVSVRLITAPMSQGTAEILAYGTAVKLKNEPKRAKDDVEKKQTKNSEKKVKNSTPQKDSLEQWFLESKKTSKKSVKN